MKVVNPATEEVIADLQEDTTQSLQQKYKQLKEGQKEWNKIPLKERIEALKVFSKLLKENIEELAKVLTAEVGKPLQQSRNEINGACSHIKWLTGNAEKYLADEWMVREDNLEEKIVYEPLGIVCNI